MKRNRVKVNKARNQSGQMVLVLLLVMIVGLTSGLLLVGRTTTDISLTTKVTDSNRAFNAAEAGVEETIRYPVTLEQGDPSPSPVAVASGVTYSVVNTDIAGTGIYPSIKQDPVQLGETFTVWMVPHDPTGDLIEDRAQAYLSTQIDLCFTDNTPEPAIGVTLFYKESGTYKSSYIGYDPDDGVTGFLDVVGLGSCSDPGYNKRAQINFKNDLKVDVNSNANIIPLALRFQPFFAASSIAVNPTGVALPKQGNNITSTGMAGDAVRKINVIDPYAIPAPFLDHVLYSTGGDVSHTD